MTSSVARRRRTAYAAAAAAKARRQKIIAIVGLVLFLCILAYEVPHTLKLFSHSDSSSVSSAAPVASQGSPRALPKAFRGASGADPFATRSLADGDPQVGRAGGGHDPFASPGTPAVAAAQPLPQQIVIGTPTKNGTALHGWIVILASIPTREGQASALSFARSARRNGLTSISVLNSSNRRPLRGGYWVVYTAPVPSLAAAERRAATVHASGYGSAYLRQLIEYR
jgi:hypothetical protein